MKSDTKNEKQVVIYLTTTEASLLDRIAREQEKPVSKIGRNLLVQFIEENL